MKTTFLCVLIATIYAASAVPVNQGVAENTFQYPRYITFPDGDGNLHNVDLEEEIDTELLNEINRNPANNVYILFTRRNPTSGQTLVMNNANSIRNSNFNPNHQTIVIVHGWLSNRNTEPNPTIRDAYLRKGDANVIVLDWSRLASSSYATAANGVPAIGRGLGQFLQFIGSTVGINLDTVHLAGFSLGAHVVGNAGRELGGRVARVTGLDPAGPLWNYNRNRINSNDGRYVEAIHTDGGNSVGSLGIGSNVADADFYPNGGVSMPGCATNLCNHNSAWRYFASTVTRNHLIANRCLTSLQISTNSCRGSQFPMGNDDLRKSGNGMYRVNTRRYFPY